MPDAEVDGEEEAGEKNGRREGGRRRAKRIALLPIVSPFLPPSASPSAQIHKNGIASATRQNALATGPVSDIRTKIGAKAMEQPPASKHRKATVEARSLREFSFGSA
jgi:hypothetical protein